MAFSEEATKELKEYAQTNAQYINVTGFNARIVDKEAVQAMYNLTLVLDGTKLTDPVF